MNTIQNKIARLIIKNKGYNEKRREKMIAFAANYDQQASHHFEDSNPKRFLALSDKAHMFRKRAAWYVKKIIDEYVPTK